MIADAPMSVGSVVLLALGAAACEEPLQLRLGTCDTLAERILRCERPGSDMAPAALARTCRQYPNDFDGLVLCSAFASCERFNECSAPARGAVPSARRQRRLGDYLDELRDALSGDRFGEAASICGYLASDPDLDSEAQARCGRLAPRAVEVLMGRLQARRDAPGGAGPGLEACAPLERYAREVGSGASERASVLCREVAAALEAESLLEPGRMDAEPPLGCSDALTAARALSTDFGRALTRRILQRCGIDAAAGLAPSKRCDAAALRIRPFVFAAELDDVPAVRAGRELVLARCGAAQAEASRP